MADLTSCSQCEGFIPSASAVCPNCGAPAPAVSWWMQRAGLWLKAAGGGAVAMTLMACYGPPPGEPREGPPEPAEPAEPVAPPDAKADAEPAPTKSESKAEPESDTKPPPAPDADAPPPQTP